MWVTNLDLRTLELAKDMVPGKWSAIAHPFMFDEKVPYPSNAGTRQKLLTETDYEFLILMAASQNCSKHHDKGSMRALQAFIELRNRGISA